MVGVSVSTPLEGTTYEGTVCIFVIVFELKLKTNIEGIVTRITQSYSGSIHYSYNPGPRDFEWTGKVPGEFERKED